MKYKVRIRNRLALIAASKTLATARSKNQKNLEDTNRLFDVIVSEKEIKNEIIKLGARTVNGLAKVRIAAASQTLVTEKKNSISFNNEA